MLINTVAGRHKDKSVVGDGRVALSLTDPDSPYRYMEVQGRVAERTGQGVDEHIDRLAQKCPGTCSPCRHPDEQRVLYRIESEHVTTMG